MSAPESTPLGCYEILGGTSLGLYPFLWPFVIAAEAAASYSDMVSRVLHPERATDSDLCEPPWSTPNTVALELPSVRVRDFSTHRRGTPALICAPLALHSATIADFAPGYSLVKTLQSGGVKRLYATDWRSATPDMRFLSIDDYLADLNVILDKIGSPVDLIGLCQGGWMALLLACRFLARYAGLSSPARRSTYAPRNPYCPRRQPCFR